MNNERNTSIKSMERLKNRRMNKTAVLKKILFSPIIFLALGLALTLVSCSGKDSRSAASLRAGETRQTLSPDQFTGETARAYTIAKEIPEVLDSLYCYCDCEKHFNHKSLLTCYVDEHASHCDICMDEAFMAYELHRQGKDVASIREAVDARFKH